MASACWFTINTSMYIHSSGADARMVVVPSPSDLAQNFHVRLRGFALADRTFWHRSFSAAIVSRRADINSRSCDSGEPDAADAISSACPADSSPPTNASRVGPNVSARNRCSVPSVTRASCSLTPVRRASHCDADA